MYNRLSLGRKIFDNDGAEQKNVYKKLRDNLIKLSSEIDKFSVVFQAKLK